MSFLPSENHSLAVDLWPSPYDAIVKQRRDISQLQQWECFPTTLARLAEWATIAKLPSSTDRSRDRILVYKTLPAPDSDVALYPVSVRLFGFLEKFCVGEYGDWNGYVLD